MHPFLLLLGSACVLYGEKLGHTVLGGIAAAVGGLLQALAKRDKIPVLRSLPKFAPPGSSFAVILSILLLLVGSVFIGLPIASTTPVGTATQIFLPVVGSGLLMLFDASSMVGLPGTPPTVVVLALCAYASACTTTGTTGPSTPVQTVISDVVDCSKTTVQHDVPDVITAVTTALATENYIAALTQLVVKFGGDVIACAVKQVGGEAAARLAASDGTATNQAEIVAHARAYAAGIKYAE